MNPQYEKSIDFLQWWKPGGPWTLAAILTSKRAIDARTFETVEGAYGWIKQHGEKRNLYFAVNTLRQRVLKKANREDVATLDWLHVDVDPRVDEDFQAERKRILHLLQNLPGDIPPATVIIDSGGGFQAFWKLENPLQLEGRLDRIEEAAKYNLQLELLLGADPCHNVDRIMRLPGTINRPDERKRKRGRIEALAEVVELHDARVYKLSEFTKAKRTQSEGGANSGLVEVSGNIRRLESIDELPKGVSDFTKVVIVQGCAPEDPSKWESRSEMLFYICCELVRAGCDDDTIFSVITDPGFEISASVLDKGSSSERYALRQIERAREDAIEPELRELNEKHAVVNVGGKCRIIREEPDQINGSNRYVISFQSFLDFQNYYRNRSIVFQNGKGEPRSVPLGQWWTAHPNRRTYEAIVFAPEQDVPGAYNLWRGFAYDAKPGDCSLFLKHVLDNVCAKSEELYTYLLGWMASAVQKPASQGHSAIVMRGRQGTGKSFFAKTFGMLFGRHFLHISDPKHLVGSFNAHLRDCVVLFGDEAFWAGDSKHESVLKRLVTEDTITIEAKGIDAGPCPNYIHLLMASNAQWVVPAGEKERRFLVLDVGDDCIQDAKYFGAINDELLSGGYEALLHYLTTYDLSEYNVRKIPVTGALQDQKMFSFTPEQEWWYAKLQAGEVVQGQKWPETIFTANLAYDFVSYMRAWSANARGNSTRLGRFMSSVCPKGHKLRGQVRGVHEVMDQLGELRKVDRPHVYVLPTLKTCRKQWDDKFGGPYDWSVPLEIDNKTEGEVGAF